MTNKQINKKGHLEGVGDKVGEGLYSSLYRLYIRNILTQRIKIEREREKQITNNIQAKQKKTTYVFLFCTWG